MNLVLPLCIIGIVCVQGYLTGVESVETPWHIACVIGSLSWIASGGLK